MLKPRDRCTGDLGILMALLVPATLGVSADKSWLGTSGPGDGFSFLDRLNWSPLGVPGPADRAIFSIEGGPVLFAAPLVVNQALVLRNVTPEVTFDLGGGVYRLVAPGNARSARSLIVSENASDDTQLILDNGTLQIAHGVIAQSSTSLGLLAVHEGSLLNGSGDLTIGEGGNGTLVVEGVAVGAAADLGKAPGSSGVATISGPGAVWIVVGDILVGDSGVGTLELSAGALTIGAESMHVGVQPGSAGAVSLLDVGTSVAVAGDLGVAGDALIAGGAGTVSVDSGASLDVGQSTVIWSDGSVEVSNGGTLTTTALVLRGGALVTDSSAAVAVGESAAAVNAGFVIGTPSGPGDVLVSDGGQMNTEGTIIGGGGAGSILVRDSGTGWTNAALMLVGDGADASLAIETGSAVSTGELKVGLDGSGQASVTVTGLGSELNSQSDLTIGVSLDPEAARSIHAFARIEDAGAVAVGGKLRVEQGGLLDLDGGAATADVTTILDVGQLRVEMIDPTAPVMIQATSLAEIGGLLTLRRDDPSGLGVGDTFRLVESATVTGEFAVASVPLLDQFRFVNVITQAGDAVDSLNAVVAPLPIKLEVDEPTQDDIPAPPNRLVVAHLGPRGLLDAAVTLPGRGKDSNGTAVVLLNNLPAPGQLPGFDIAAEIPVGVDPSGIVAGDYDGDGFTDLAVSNRGSSSVTLIRNATGSALGPPFMEDQTLDLNGIPTGVAFADLNGDRILDVAASLVELNEVQVIFGVGGGGFSGAQALVTGSGPQGVCPLDVDNDKDTDIVTINSGGVGQNASVSVLLSNITGGGEGFLPAVNYAIGTGPVGLTEADLNGDELPEIITANAGDQTISILVNLGRDGFKAAVDLPCGGVPTAITAADLDNDLNQDADVAVLVTNDKGEPALTVFRNDTVGGSIILTTIEDAQSIFGLPTALAAGDADSDGPADLVTAGEAESGVAGSGGAISVLVASPVQCVGSVNGDDVVDGSDLGLLLGEWGPNPGSPYDLDGDGEVGSSDLGLLLASWGPCQ